MQFRNNPDLVLPRVLDRSSDLFHECLSNIVREITGAPSSVDFNVSQLTGGMTNILFKVLPCNKELWNEAYVVRIYGDGTELYIDRKRENFVFAALSKVGLAPPFVGLFQNGRIEGYLSARPLELEEFKCPKILPHIASATAKLHASSVDIDTAVGAWEKLNEFFALGIGKEINCLLLIRTYILIVLEDCVDRGEITCTALPADIRDLHRESQWCENL
jgi:hypothetical protein